jgi:hypothetical protein
MTLARHSRRPYLFLTTALVLAVVAPAHLMAADGYVPFDGAASSWHGFDRHDFLLDATSLAIAPYTTSTEEKNGISGNVPGKRRCVIVVPKTIAPGAPWSWRGCYWDHEPQTEIELLNRGFHIAYITANADMPPDQKWDAWYAFLTGTHGLSAKPAFIGMSRGGLFAYTWATANPTKVSCIYADNPAIDRDVFSRLVDLARQDVPLLHVCGSIDPLLGRCSLPVESIYQQLGGRISLMIKDGAGHHPHSLRDPKPIADFITSSVLAQAPALPAYVGQKATRSAFYGDHSTYRDAPGEGLHILCRGPLVAECYDRYSFELLGIEGAITVIAPHPAAAGMPWVLRADAPTRDARVDLALLAHGYHIVTGPVPYNADGPSRPAWDALYAHLTGLGFSPKPVLEGAGESTGEVVAWAIENPGKASCIYGQNPLLVRSRMSHTPLLGALAPLAKAGIPILAYCGDCPAELVANASAVQKLYTSLGGAMSLVTEAGPGQGPTAPKDVSALVDALLHAVK